ncbi:hypothetical protein BKA70DRAFT_1501173 [Coprinopsis sp. MPI-PUGE-AT-0042]|nr:hypothetical protein BKA70DRAFT_1501173 [Coprinopsis sp. MPI-PUGE-AT-0042]
MSLPVFPNEILDHVVDLGAEMLSTRSVFGVKNTAELLKLLKNVALTCRHLRERAQRHLFTEIHLSPSSRKGSEAIQAKQMESTWNAFISIFKENPQLLDYPRSLIIAMNSWGGRGNLPHFLSVLLPFFANNLQALEHLHISVDSNGKSWRDLQSEFQDAIVDCLRRNRDSLKSFKIRGLKLPKEFSDLLPPTLQGCSFGANAEDDLTFITKYTGRRDTAACMHTASPSYLEILGLGNAPHWTQSQQDSFFRRLSYLDIEIWDLQAFEMLMDRVPDTLTYLSLRDCILHCKSANTSFQYQVDVLKALSLQQSAVRRTKFRRMPQLKELHVQVLIRFQTYSAVPCPVEAAMIAGGYATTAYASIRVFRLTLRWPLVRNMEDSPTERFLERTQGGFAHLDDLLSDAGIFPSLKLVEIVVQPYCITTRLINMMAGRAAVELRRRIHCEIVEVFYKTVRRVDVFSVQTSYIEAPRSFCPLLSHLLPPIQPTRSSTYPSQGAMAALPMFPNEILDHIVDSAADMLSIRSVFGVKNTADLVELLKNVALACRHLRERAQRHLFTEIRLLPFKAHKKGEEGYTPSTWDSFLSIFKDNPQLLDYPHSLDIDLQRYDWAGDLPLHFLSAVVPFFVNLRSLEHVSIYLAWKRRWVDLPREFQDAIANLLKGNNDNSKSFKLANIHLPKQFSDLLPHKLEACSLGICLEDDPVSLAKYIETWDTATPAHGVSPIYLEIVSLHGDKSFWWTQSQPDTFFQRIRYLDIGIRKIAEFEKLMNRVPGTLTHLSLRHRVDARSLSLQHSALQATTLRCFPKLKELGIRIKVLLEPNCAITCPVQAAMIAGDYANTAYASIRVFRLTIQWLLPRDTEDFPADKFLERAPCRKNPNGPISAVRGVRPHSTYSRF